MHLEVQLACPNGNRRTGGHFLFDVIEELVRRSDGDGRDAIEIGHAPGAFQHLARWSTAAVSVAERHQRPRAPTVLLEVPLGIVHLGCRDLGVVRVDRRKVREHPSAVEALPPERRMRKQVLLVPAQLLGDESCASSVHEHLRECGRIPEHVGDPDLGVADAEPRLEVALAVHQLTGDALTARQVHVGLYPHTAHRLPLPGRHLVADALEQRRVLALDPLVLGGLRTREAVLGVVVHQAHCRREGACALALRFADRPQPCRVDVRMPDRDHPVGTGPCSQRQRRFQQSTCRSSGVSDVVEVEHVERGLELSQHPYPACVIEDKCPGEAQQHVDVEQQCRRRCRHDGTATPAATGRAACRRTLPATPAATARNPETPGSMQPRRRTGTGLGRSWAAAARYVVGECPVSVGRRSTPGLPTGSRQHPGGTRDR